MKNKTPLMNESVQNRVLDWLFQEQEDDFLMGKTPSNIEYAWEDEE